MDTNAQLKSAEARPIAEVKKSSAESLELSAPPAAAESASNAPARDDGATSALQLASIVADEATPPVSNASSSPATSTPAPAAADVDVIEPVWVKKAEEAVAANRDDPHAQEQAVGEVQADYLRQRYNIEIAKDETKP